MAKEYLEKLSNAIEGIRKEIGEEIALECKHFFSGAALYVDQKICVSLTPVGLAMKLPEDRKEEILNSKIAIPLRYFENAPIKKEYVLIPGDLNTNWESYNELIKESTKYVSGLT